METRLHTYEFDTARPDDAKAYAELKEKLKTWSHKMKSHGGGKRHLEIGELLAPHVLVLETKCLFDNQWNTAPIDGVSDKGYRVFDWAEDVFFDSRGNERKNIRQGYYLDQTDAMREVRRNTSKCGYCGKQEPAAKGYVFCPHCIDSEYLTEKNLYLTRMLPCDTLFGHERAALSEAERAYLLPLFKAAQLDGATERGKARIAKLRQKIAGDRAKAIEQAETEFAGYTWLMDHGFAQLAADNVIFYNHTGRFGFGWRKALDGETLSALLDAISEFRWQYEIKCADGRTLNGNVG